ncbi:MAG TPA: hypothetical protein VFB45_14835 [Pseudolabrys sp.]|nr:hypothetical protein [Pseudolabrys sp.]
MFFASFAAAAVLLCSATAVAIWVVFRFLRAIIRFPRTLREWPMRARTKRAVQADLLRLKRAGA